MKILIGLCLLASAIAAPNYDCTSMVQLGRTAEDAEKTDCPVSMTVDKMTYRAGEKVTVSIVSSQPITTFMLQARKPADDMPLGSWEVNAPLLLTTHQCREADDTVISVGYNPTETFAASWVAPQDRMAIQIEFIASVANPEGNFWTGCNSILMRFTEETPVGPPEEEAGQPVIDEEEITPPEEEVEPANPNEDPNDPERIDAAQREESLAHDLAGQEADNKQPTENKTTANNPAEEDLHDAKREEEQALLWKEKLAKLTDSEDAESEGEWTKKDAEEKKKHEQDIHEEMIQYEERQAKEEEERMARIRMEILDKEEWDAQQERENKLKPGNENEVTLDEKQQIVGDSGASAFAVSLTLMVLTLFAYCLP